MDNREKAIKHLLKFTQGHSWWAAGYKNPTQFYSHQRGGYYKEDYHEVSAGACYAGIDLKPSEYTFIALGYYCDKGDSAGKNFLSWVLGEKSPWRALFKDEFELIQTDTHIHGFFIGPKTLEEANTKFLKNFMIATRAFNEFEDHIRLWDYLVQNGIPQDRAFYYCSNLVLHKGEPYVKYVHNDNHWAWDSAEIDFDRVKNSTPNLNQNQTNGIWGNNKQGKNLYSLGEIIEKSANKKKSLSLQAVLKFDKEFKDANCKLS